MTIPVLTLILNLSTVAIDVVRGDPRRQRRRCSIGNLTAFLQYLTQILFSVLTAVFVFVFVPRAAVSAGRIREVLDTSPAHPRSRRRRSLCQRPISTARSGGRVEFRDVDFRYPGAENAGPP